MNAPRRQTETRPLRAAIYCRKSTSRGLEQDFNSLDAQREACARYIHAQAHQGWTALQQTYEDGGFTGANLERPGFQRLLADIEAGHVDVVVVYKVDRLSRSLLDFAQLMDRFDEAGVAFVSVTQNFSTADAMGRLTLNILLSFAQFEREMIAERTRDKIQAARRRGKWTGGPLPLGYGSDDKKLVINEAEALIVRQAFDLYERTRSAGKVQRLLRDAGHRSRRGKVIGKGSVLHMLKNGLYSGRIRVDGVLVEGEHDAIVPIEQFERVQGLLQRRKKPQGRRRNTDYLLAGLIRCAGCGGAYTPTSASRDGRRYRYYRCATRDRKGKAACDARPLPAETVEDFVVAQLQHMAAEPGLVAEVTDALRGKVYEEQAALRAEQRLLPPQVAQLTEEAARLVDALGKRTGPAQALVEDKLQQVAQERADKEARLAEVEARLARLDEVQAEVGWVTEALSRFDEVWRLMAAPSRSQFVAALVARVEVDEPTGDIAVVLTDVGASLQEVA